ncbi:pancreatic triacylglycerol lipase-like [Choristoneura fumiferana]|uniref:pancreatic triacylglycerol lipase-like n=1 Tax=Choristoneura fumiferana TaxID=7141 RepID=UPI003D1557ED
MLALTASVLLLAAAAALPTNDLVISKLGGDRYQYMRAGNGVLHLVDTWLKVSDLNAAARYAPDTQNVYHLFTRANPTVSQPILIGANGVLGSSNFNPSRRTIMILHGWIDNVLGDVTTVLIPAFLEAEDVNVIAVDWSAGASTINYAAAVVNTVTSGEAVARFINWLNQSTGSTPAQFHIAGHSLGGHQSGIIGRNVNGNIACLRALDPALPGWITNDNKFRANDGAYTEVIHTNAGLLGYITNLGHTDFYPNGGINMPGCNSQQCDHDRCFYYLAESLRTGGFTGTRCATYAGAMTGNCVLWGNLQMGGLRPKTGSTGIYYLQTNAAPPFSRG